MKLHIGCGNRFLPGWIHIDVADFDHIDHKCDIKNIETIFAKESVDEIYACHVIEHLGRHEVSNMFISLFNILKPGGKLRIAVPDIENAIQLYNKGTPLYPTLYGLLWGGQRNNCDFHYIGFDLKTLSNQLCEIGFKDIERYDWRNFLPQDYDDYSRACIPHMDFDNGTSVSLNVIATKI